MILESGADPRPFLFTHPELVRSLPEIEAAERGYGSIDQEADPDGSFAACLYSLWRRATWCRTLPSKCCE